VLLRFFYILQLNPFIIHKIEYMPKIIWLLCLTLCVSISTFSQNQENEENEIKYFNENYIPISKSAYKNKRIKYDLWSIPGDSANHEILAYKEIQGKINNKDILDALLAEATNTIIDPLKPTVIMYYPGKDICNSTATLPKRAYKARYDKMEKKVNRIAESTIVYVYKDDEGLYDRFQGFKTWIKDPNGIIEKLFFSRHYPCNSFVVISSTGDFISHRGETHPENVWKALKELSKRK